MAFGDEQLEELLGGVDHAAGVGAQVDDESLARELAQDVGDRFDVAGGVVDVEGPEPEVAEGAVAGLDAAG